jgi:hypothetical protein
MDDVYDNVAVGGLFSAADGPDEVVSFTDDEATAPTSPLEGGVPYTLRAVGGACHIRPSAVGDEEDATTAWERLEAGELRPWYHSITVALSVIGAADATGVLRITKKHRISATTV